MENFYLPIYDDNYKHNNINIYSMKYNKDSLKEFLDYIRLLYQDKYIRKNSLNDLIECNIDPLLYTILMDMTHSDVLDLRFFGIYMCINFKKNISNNYTENDKLNILLQLKNDESIKDIDFSTKEELSNIIYKIELQQISKNLTISEKSMTIKEFEKLIFQFFDLFDIEKVKLKRNYMEYIMSGKYEVALTNSKILNHESFQKVYKKIF